MNQILRCCFINICCLSISIAPLFAQIENADALPKQFDALGESSMQLTKLDIGLNSRKTDAANDKDTYASLHLFKDRERDEIGSLTTGSIWKVTLDASHPIAFGYPSLYFTLKRDPTLFEYLKKDTGWNVGVLKKEVALAGFVGSQLDPKLKDGVLIGQIPVGRGSVSFFADNILFRNFWENGKLLLCNALFFNSN